MNSSTPKLVSQVELHISCAGLPNLDVMSKSDCFVVVYIKSEGGLNSANTGPAGFTDPSKLPWHELKRTSTVRNTLDPEWPDQVLIDYHFELVQELRFDVYDRDGDSYDLSKHDFVGTVRTTLSRIMGSRGATFSNFLENTKRAKQRSGRIVIKGEEVSTCKDALSLQLEGRKLERKNMLGFGRSDPFFTISRSREDGSFVKVWQSETIRGNLNPVWAPAQIAVQVICNGDYDRPFRIDVYDWESDGDHKFIAGVTTSLRSLQVSKELNLANDQQKKKKGDKYKNSGIIVVRNINVQRRFSFLDYVRGGCELNLIVAIDFTASNGDPRSTQSLHYQHPNINFDGSMRNVVDLNEYQRAILSVGQILQDYDSDAQFPLFGFGGVVNGVVDHCFPLTFDPQRPEVHGVQGILESYKNAFNYVTLNGPTLFSGILRMANAYAARGLNSGRQRYTILLILTDGVINDMENTIAEIVEGSALPLSIVIVGVGNADFTNMRALDADGSSLVSNGKRMKRDIVQFVPFRKYYNMHFSALAAETLAEIPNQLVNYMQTMNVTPNPPISTSAVYPGPGSSLGSTQQQTGNAQVAYAAPVTSGANPPAPAYVAAPYQPPRGQQL